MEDFRALLVVDAEKFSAHRDTELPDLHMEIRHVLAAACEASGLGEIWNAVRFLESTGDGILAVLPHQAMRRLVEPFPTRLQEALAESAPKLRARGLRLRLRVALHVGLVDDERPEAPGISTAVIDVCRLLDGTPLREALEQSDPDVTFVALLLSAEVFGQYVVGGRTTLRASQFTEVNVMVKQFARPAYLFVPVPSEGGTSKGGALEDEAKSAGDDDTALARSGGTTISGVTINGDGAQNVFGNTAGGDLHVKR